MSHLDEGTLHALIDGEISSEELGPIEAHLATCPECRARLDEARGFVRTADRLVGMMDLPAERDTPAEVAPPAPARRRTWRPRVSPSTLGWAAGLMLVAGGTWLLTNSARPVLPGIASADKARLDTVPLSAAAPAGQQAPASAPTPAPTSAPPAVTAEAPPAAPTPSSPSREPSEPKRAAEADERERRDGLGAFSRTKAPAVQSQLRAPAAVAQGTAAATSKDTEALEKAKEDTAARVLASKARQFKPEVPGPRPSTRRSEVVADAAPPSSAANAVGRVVDAASGRAIGQATIQIRGSGERVTTDSAGRFVLPPRPAPVDSLSIDVRALGYRRREAIVALGGDSATVIRLTEEPARVDEVVTSGSAASSVALDSAAAARRAGGRLRAIAGLVPARYERVPDDPNGVRTIYILDGGREVALDQRRGAHVDSLGAGLADGAAAPAPDAGVRVTEWRDGSLVLRLAGAVSQDVLASLRARVR